MGATAPDEDAVCDEEDDSWDVPAEEGPAADELSTPAALEDATTTEDVPLAREVDPAAEEDPTADDDIRGTVDVGAEVDDCAEVPSEDGPVPEDVAALAGADVPEGALPAALVDDAATLPEDDVVSG